MKLPTGIQSFEKLREDGFLYVDKTEYIYQLVQHNVPYFLSRPRRFGKSLLLSALKAYWEGKKELFNGLEIERLEEGNPEAWKAYPVFAFDFNGNNYLDTSIETVLDGILSDWEELYGNQYRERPIGDRFQKLLELANKKTGRRCVILIDEYDKPLMDTIGNPEVHEHIKKVLKGFWGRLKMADEYLQFIFITGVTKFHKVSIFSDLNQLTDISINEDFTSLCGITENEIDSNLLPFVEAMAKKRGMTTEACRAELRRQYDGYHFSRGEEAVYNPYSLLNALFAGDFGAYWYETGTPTFLVNRIKESSFDVRRLTNHSIYANEATLKDYTGEGVTLIPLLYQTGYLTIGGYDEKRKRFILCFPNEEVKYGFLGSLIPSYVPKAAADNGLDIFSLDEYIENGQLNETRDFFTALFASIPYTSNSNPFEHYFQTVIYLVFTLLGKFCECEMHTFNGRIDCVVKTNNYIYIFEFKRDDTAKSALDQIEDMEYALPFISDSRQLFKIGVAFDSESRKLTEWKVAE